MKKYSIVLLTTTFSIIAFAAIFTISCNRNSGNLLSTNKCAAISCAYGGVCRDGACFCQPGYEGNNCEIITKNKYLGSWNVKEHGSVTEPAEYTVIIETDADPTVVRLKNFYNYFKGSVAANVVKDTIIIPNQQLEGKVVYGRGYIYTDSPGIKYGKLSLQYQVIDVKTQLVNDFGYHGAVTKSSPSAWAKMQ